MKKLVLSVAVIAMALASHAATVSWASGVGIKGPSGSYMPAGDIKMYVFEFANADAYNAADIASLDVSSAKLSGATTKSTTGITLSDSTTYGANDTVYSAVIFKATDAGKDYYMGQKLMGTIDELGSNLSFTSLKNLSGSSTALSWSEAGGSSGGVPEPTSGLLLLVGGAMLALRRKQK